MKEVRGKGSKMRSDKVKVNEPLDEREELIQLILSLTEEEVALVIRRAGELPGLR